VIGRSDLFILVVSASLLAVGIYRWQNNLSQLSANAQQAQVQQVVPASNSPVVSTISSANTVTQTAIPAVTGVQTSASVAVSNPAPVVVVTNVADPVVPAVVANTTAINGPLYGSHIVISGDYLAKIAQQYGTTVETLQSVNSIVGTLIEVGDEIQFPLPAN
jgi:LysM repeat protein